MAAIFGSFVMGSALAVYKKPVMLIGVGLIAAAAGWLSVPFLPDPVRATYYGPWIANATAVIVGAFSLALVAAFAMKRLEKSVPARVGVGVLSGLVAPTLFILATAYGVDKTICADLGYAGLAAIVALCFGGGIAFMIGL